MNDRPPRNRLFWILVGGMISIALWAAVLLRAFECSRTP